MKKRSLPTKLHIRRETLTSLAATPMKRAAGATWDFCTEVCTYMAICRTGTCPSVDNDCHYTAEASCFC